MKTLLTTVGICLATIGTPVAAGQTPMTVKETRPMLLGAGAEMVPPEGWQVARDGDLIRFTPPERDFTVTIVPVTNAKDAADAAVQAWRRADPALEWPVRLSQRLPAREGWDEVVQTSYEVPPAEKKITQAVTFRRGSG